MTSDTKDKILQRAARLFFREGFSTGIDRVVRECDVAKMTVYQHFKTKEGLICSILDEIRTLLQAKLRGNSTRPGKTPDAQLEEACLILCEAMHDPDLRAGLAVQALFVFPDPRNPVHEKARQLDVAILRTFERLCEDASLPEPSQAARQILQIAKGRFLMTPTVGLEASEKNSLALLSSVLAQVPEVPTAESGTRPRRGHSPVLSASRK